MNEKNQQQQDNQSGEQNPTLNSPGSKVADYGNPTGGSSVQDPQQSEEANSNRSGNTGTEAGNNVTVGNP